MDSAGSVCLLSEASRFSAHRAASPQDWTDTLVTYSKVCADCSRMPTTLFCLQGGERLSNKPSASLWCHRHCLFGVCVCILLFDPLALFTGILGMIYQFSPQSFIWFLCLFMYCSSNIRLHFGVSFIVVDNSCVWNGNISILMTALWFIMYGILLTVVLEVCGLTLWSSSLMSHDQTTLIKIARLGQIRALSICTSFCYPSYSQISLHALITHPTALWDIQQDFLFN